MKRAVRRLLQASMALVLTVSAAEPAAASIGAATELARIIRAQREGGGGVSRDAHVLVSGGDPPFLYDWRSENPVFLIDYLPQGPRAGLYAPVAACDTQETVLKVTVIDRAGRRASALADVAFHATRAPGGVCD